MGGAKKQEGILHYVEGDYNFREPNIMRGKKTKFSREGIAHESVKKILKGHLKWYL